MDHSDRYILLSLIWQFYPLPDAQKRLDALPLYGKDFVSQDIPLSDFEETFFKNVNIIKRIYRIDSITYFVTVLDGTRNRHIVHDPYYCFTGSGWDIIAKKPFSLEHGDAEEITISKGNRTKGALFWFTEDRQITHLRCVIGYKPH